MAETTAQALVREFAARQGEFYLATAANTGSPTLLVDANLLTMLPVDIPSQFNAWVYGGATADVANRGVERRAASFSATAAGLTLYAPGFPTACTTGAYEIHSRTARSRKLAALNAAIRLLHLAWFRPVRDQTLTTVTNTWEYALPNTVLWESVARIELQVSTDNTLIGYPYADARAWDSRLYRAVDANGVTTWYLQFGVQPPSGRLIRFLGQAAYTDLVADTDVLPLEGDWAGPAVEWIYDYAAHKLWTWEANKQPSGDAQKAIARAEQILQEARQELLENRPTPLPSHIVVPGMGDGSGLERTGGPGYLAAWRMLH